MDFIFIITEVCTW